MLKYEAEETGVRLTKRQRQALETKDRIYNAAVKVINEKGINNISIEDITTAANVAKGSFYTYFDSKEAVALYTYEQSDQIYEQAYELVKHLDFLRMITCFIRISYTEYEKRGKGIIKAIITSYYTNHGVQIYGKDRPLLRYLVQIVEKGKEQQVLDAEVNTDWYVDLLLVAMIGAEALWCFKEDESSLVKIVEDAVRTTAKGMMIQ